MTRKLLLTALVLLTLLATGLASSFLTGCGSASEGQNGTRWSFMYSPNVDGPHAYGQEAQFTFPTRDGVHYLVTDPRSTSAIQASVTIETSGNPEFEFRTAANNTCPGVGTFGLYFERKDYIGMSAPDGKYEFYRWWSTKRHALGEGTVQLFADLADPTQWTSVFGKRGADHPAAFRAAVADMRLAGFSFGGGCFYGHGVFIVPGTGSAVFKVNSFL